MFTKALVTAVVVVPVFAVAALAQQSGIKRTPLQTVDFPAGYNVVSVIAEIPSGCAGRHTHPGVESTYVMEGEAIIKVEGQPDRTVKAGESFQIRPAYLTTPARPRASSRSWPHTLSRRGSRSLHPHRSATMVALGEVLTERRYQKIARRSQEIAN